MQAVHTPGQRRLAQPHRALLKQQQRSPLERDQSLKIGYAIVHQAADLPAPTWPRCNEVSVHGPVRVERQRDDIARVVVTRGSEWINVCYLDHRFATVKQRTLAGGGSTVRSALYPGCGI